MKAKRPSNSQASSQKDQDQQPKSKEDFHSASDKKIYSLKTKFERCVTIGSTKNEIKRREVSTRLAFTQVEGSKLSLEGVLQTLKHSKIIKDLSFDLHRLNNQHLNLFEQAIFETRSSLNSLSFRITKPRSLTLKGFNRLITMIGEFPSLQKIYLSLNLSEGLDDLTYSRLLSTLNKLPKLKKLHLDFSATPHAPPSTFHLETLLVYLEKQNRFEYLGLDLSSSQEISDKVFKRFLGVMEQLKSLKTLRLYIRGHRAMTDPRIKKFSTSLKKLESLQTLDLDFTASSVSNIGIPPFAACLKQFPLLHTLNLNFSGGTSITAECLKTLSNSISKISSLRELSLDLNRVAATTGDKPIINLAKGLTSLTSLTHFSLYLSGGLYSTNEGLKNFGKLLQEMESLKSLCFVSGSSEQTTNEGLNEIYKALQKLTALQNLKLSFSGSKQITGEALANILEALVHTKSLNNLSLDFSWCEIIDKDLQALPSVFKKLHFLPRLTLLFDNCNQLTDPGFYGLCRCLPYLVSLRYLQLSLSYCYQITLDAISSLKETFMRLPSLKTIDLKQKLYYPENNKFNERLKTYAEIQQALPFKQINVHTIYY